MKAKAEGKDIVVQSIQNENWESDNKDSFGRWLAILFIDGENINELMVEAGHAEKAVY